MSCPTGMLATGGGGSIIPLDDPQPLPQLTESQPVGSQTTATTWEVAAWSAVPSAEWELFVYVMCAYDRLLTRPQTSSPRQATVATTECSSPGGGDA